MLYQIISNEYFNNGGRNMVTVCEVHLPIEKTTLWVSLDSTDCLITTVDVIRDPIYSDYADIATKYACSINELEVDNVYYKLIRHCLKLHAMNITEFDGARTYLPFIALDDSLQELVTQKYFNWCKEYNYGEYETDGYVLYEHVRYNTIYANCK